MAKFLPVFGELVTVIESTGKLVAAGVTAPFDQEKSKKLLDSAGHAWVDYKNQSLVPCVVRGDGKAIVEGADAMSKSVPVVAHVRGTVHYIRGETQQGTDCMVNGTKTAGVMAATAITTVATGGLGTPAAVALAGGAAAGSQVALDGVDTGVRSAVAGKLKAAGTIEGFRKAAETGDPVDIADAVLAPVQTAGTAAAGAGLARFCAARAMAGEQNLSGTGMENVNGPKATPNSQLTPDSLAKLPPKPPSQIPASSGPSSAVPSSAVPSSSAPSAAPSMAVSSASGTHSLAATDGSIRSSASTRGPVEFENKLREITGADEIRLRDPAQIRARQLTKKLDFLVDQDGNLYMWEVRRNGQQLDVCHGDLGIDRVQFAGEVKFNHGQVQAINNASGHFQPKGNPISTAVKNMLRAFDRAGCEYRDNAYYEWKFGNPSRPTTTPIMEMRR